MPMWTRPRTRCIACSCAEPAVGPALRARRCSDVDAKQAPLTRLPLLRGCWPGGMPCGAPSGGVAMSGLAPLGAWPPLVGARAPKPPVVVTPVGAGSAPVAGGGSSGKSSVATVGPSAVPISALRCVSFLRIRSPSTVPPMRTARGGLPSIVSKATPPGWPSPGATSPISLRRAARAEAAVGSACAAPEAVLAGPARSLRSSPCAVLSIETGVALAGTPVGRAIQRKPQ